MADGWALAGAPNARDLGGLVGVDGRRIRPGVLIRASALGRLVDDDLPALGELGLACVVDLRGAIGDRGRAAGPARRRAARWCTCRCTTRSTRSSRTSRR